ncbi:GNAT family N-acetyltransferase [Halobacillus fulvus]|nr:GNAT family N-acetyltransferase [Halobacillus fulvus]
MRLEQIDLKKHRDTVIQFRKDSFKASFGDTSGFGEESEYLSWLEDKIKSFPKGFVLMVEGGRYIGQLELTIREHEGTSIGYVHLYYLIPEVRGKGKGVDLHLYAEQFFKDHKVKEYHLRVSPSNMAAIQFYKRLGMREVGPELEGRVIRMKGFVGMGQ